MREEYAYPSCAEILVTIPSEFNIPDPLWPWLGFLIALFGGIFAGSLFGWCCLRDYFKMKQQDEENQTLIALGIPLSKRGQEINRVVPSMKGHTDFGNDEVKKLLPEKEKTPSGLSDALLCPTNESTEAELMKQDLRDFSAMEMCLFQERIDVFLALLHILLNTHPSTSMLDSEATDKIISDLKSKFSQAMQTTMADEQTAVEALLAEAKSGRDSPAVTAEIDLVHFKHIQRLNSDFSSIENEVPAYLAIHVDLTEEDIDSLMQRLKQQLAIRERRVGDEMRRQILNLEERLARRKELAELLKLQKSFITHSISAKVESIQKHLEVSPGTRKDDLISGYSQDLMSIYKSSEEGTKKEETALIEKLSKTRQARIKKLMLQQHKLTEECLSRLKNSKLLTDVQNFDEFLSQQHRNLEETITETDMDEFKQMMQFYESLQNNMTNQFTSVDQELFQGIRSNRSDLCIKPADVDKIIKIHKAEMYELEKNQLMRTKKMNDKLQESIAMRKQKRNVIEQEAQASFQVYKEHQDKILEKVIESQPNLTEDAVKRIVEEHHRNMENINNQLLVSRVRQEKALEERIARRRALLAEKTLLSQGTAGSTDKKTKLEGENKKINLDQEYHLTLLRKNMAEETRLALEAHEQQMSTLIGQLEVGQARRKNILMKQDKLISELENQLTTKAKNNVKGLTTVSELMQKHYGQVSILTNSLQSTRERQEKILLEKIQQKKLHRKEEIREHMKQTAQIELEKMRRNGTSVASNVLLEMMLQQRHEKALENLDREMNLELQRAKNQINEQLNAELLSSLSEEGKNFMAVLASSTGLTNSDITDAMNNAAKAINANDGTVKKLAREMRLRVKTVNGQR